jgi:hypothetical protein
MSDERANPGTAGDGAVPAASVPQGLVAAVVHLVSTGPVPLGAYTLAELTAVDAVVDFLEVMPSDEVLAEAVRSLAARQLLVAAADGQVQVRGDLGIALAFQQRARTVLDARATGTQPGEPWRVLLLPQPEGITLEVRIDALGVHELWLYQTAEALERTAEWLPGGDHSRPTDGVDPNDVVASADRSALITAVRYSAQGTAEVADESRDLVIAVRDGRQYFFARDRRDPSRLVVSDPKGDDPKEMLQLLLAG